MVVVFLLFSLVFVIRNEFFVKETFEEYALPYGEVQARLMECPAQSAESLETELVALDLGLLRAHDGEEDPARGGVAERMSGLAGAAGAGPAAEEAEERGTRRTAGGGTMTGGTASGSGTKGPRGRGGAGKR